MYLPVLTRLRTYGVPIAKTVTEYAVAFETLPAVQQLVELARSEPHIRVYDDYLRGLGGEPDAVFPAG